MSSELVPAPIETIEQDMTREEALHAHRMLLCVESAKKFVVRALWKRNGWKHLGFTSFESYCEEVLEVSKTTAYRWIWQVEASLNALNIRFEEVFHFDSDTPPREIPSLLPSLPAEILRRLPTPEMQCRAYKEYFDRYGRKEQRYLEIHNSQLPDLKRIVATYLPSGATRSSAPFRVSGISVSSTAVREELSHGRKDIPDVIFRRDLPETMLRCEVYAARWTADGKDLVVTLYTEEGLVSFAIPAKSIPPP